MRNGGPATVMTVISYRTIMKSLINIHRSCLLCLLGAVVMAQADPLQDAFEHPSTTNRPQTLWFWLNGHISREGITADIEAMSKNHIQGALMYAIGHEKQAGPVRFMSDEWIDLFLHTVREASRCGTEIGIHNGAGWSASGSQWNGSPSATVGYLRLGMR